MLDHKKGNLAMLNQLKVRSRLFLLAAVPLTALVVLCTLSLFDMKQLASGVDSLYVDRVQPLQQIKQVSDAYAVTIVDTLHKHRGGLLDAQQAIDAMDVAEREAQNAWQAYRSTQMTAEETQLMNAAETLIAQWSQELQRYRSQLSQGEIAAMAPQEFNEALYNSADPLSVALNRLIELQLKEAGRFTESAKKSLSQTVWLFMFILLVS